MESQNNELQNPIYETSHKKIKIMRYTAKSMKC